MIWKIILAMSALTFFWLIPLLFYIAIQLLLMYWCALKGTRAFWEDLRSSEERFGDNKEDIYYEIDKGIGAKKDGEEAT